MVGEDIWLEIGYEIRTEATEGYYRDSCRVLRAKFGVRQHASLVLLSRLHTIYPLAAVRQVGHGQVGQVADKMPDLQDLRRKLSDLLHILLVNGSFAHSVRQGQVLAILATCAAHAGEQREAAKAGGRPTCRTFGFGQLHSTSGRKQMAVSCMQGVYHQYQTLSGTTRQRHYNFKGCDHAHLPFFCQAIVHPLVEAARDAFIAEASRQSEVRFRRSKG